MAGSQRLIASGLMVYTTDPVERRRGRLMALFLFTAIWAIFSRPNSDMLAVWWQKGSVSIEPSAHLLTAALWLGIPLLLWLSAYWNLRERQLS